MMHPDTFYHIFNRGNQRQLIFLRERNYLYFLDKIKSTFLDDTDIVAYCLMPNHFHLIAYTHLSFEYLPFSKRLGKMLSSYTRGLQNQQKFVGSLFQQNTRKKALLTQQDVYNCFQYVHQNPLKANLAERFDKWKYSSFLEYYNSKPKICNIVLGRRFLDLPLNPNLFYDLSLSHLR